MWMPRAHLLACAALLSLVRGDGGNQCGSFFVNGSSTEFFSYYRFYDWRDLSQPTAAAASSSGPPISKFVTDATWTKDWKVRIESREASSNKTIPFQYSASNVLIGRDSSAPPNSATHLTLIAQRSDSSQQAGETDYIEQNVTYASIRVLARVSGAAGAVAGIFTYHNDTDESDIEILTRDPDKYVHYSNQPTMDKLDAPIPGTQFNVSIPGTQKWTDWNIYRLDWLADRSVWYVNGVEVASTKLNVPRQPSGVMLNMWSNGGPFSGSMIPGTQARLDIQWLEMSYNVSGASPSTSTTSRCSIDKAAGSPSASAAQRGVSISSGVYFSAIIGLFLAGV